MRKRDIFKTAPARTVHRVLILADESATWRIAGLRQLDRLVLTLNEFAKAQGKRDVVRVCVLWKPDLDVGQTWMPNQAGLTGLGLADQIEGSNEFDLVLNTHVFLYRESVAQLLEHLAPRTCRGSAGTELWQNMSRDVRDTIQATLNAASASTPWVYVSTRSEIARCEKRFLKFNGKSQDGLASRHLNRPFSRSLSRWLLKLPITPSAWSLLIFALPICAAFAFLQGTYLGFVAGAAIFQLYSIVDGCDGEIARAKFLQTEFGRRLDSLCDLIGNLLLALSLGLGLALQAERAGSLGWIYIAEGIAATLLIVLSEGIVFARRSRSEAISGSFTKWNGALYQRHQEFFERSGILFLGERFAWWLVQLTKRDMAMIAFLFLALVGLPAWSLHLLLAVSAISSALAGNAFLRQPAPALPQEAS